MMNARTTLAVVAVVAGVCLAATASDVAAQTVSRPRSDVIRLGALQSFSEQTAAPRGSAARCLDALKKSEDSVAFGCWGFPFLGSAKATRKEIASMFGGLRTGGYVAITGGSDQATAYAELLSDNLYLGSSLGYARIAFATLLASGDSATTAEQFFDGGGNAVLVSSLPLFQWLNAVRDPDDKSQARIIRQLDLFGSLAGGFDVPALGGATSSDAFNIRGGLQGSFYWLSLGDVFQFFVEGDGWGGYGTDAFFSNAQVDPEGSNWFASYKVTLGVDLNRFVRLAASRGSSSIEGLETDWRISLQLIPRRDEGAGAGGMNGGGES